MRVRLLFLCATLLLPLCGCNLAGPVSLGGGRSAYNRIVNQTEDEQLLSAIVRHRYDETFGLLAVTSITANIRLSSSVGVNAGIGPRSSFEGNLVPLSAGVAYEENPTISYVPVRGEEFVERMLAPLTADQALLLSRMSTPQCEPLRLLIRRVNGKANPLFASGDTGQGFARFVELFVQLREKGTLDIVRLSTGEYELLFHDLDTAQASEAEELLSAIGVTRPVPTSGELRIPLRFFVGASAEDGVEVETPTALEVLRAAALGVDIPPSHLADGIARPITVTTDARWPLIVHTSQERPAHGYVSVSYRGYWYSVDERDIASKQAFVLLRTLVGLRLDAQSANQQAPVLTVPVGR